MAYMTFKPYSFERDVSGFLQGGCYGFVTDLGIKQRSQ